MATVPRPVFLSELLDIRLTGLGDLLLCLSADVQFGSAISCYLRESSPRGLLAKTSVRSYWYDLVHIAPGIHFEALSADFTTMLYILLFPFASVR